jgi:hypothetical protein
MRVVRSLTALLVCAFVLALAAPALAQSPAEQAYGGVCGSQQTACEPDGTLPFTGINAGVVGVLGVVLLGAGFAVRKGIRTRTE